MSRQNVQHDTSGMDVVRQRFRTGHFDGLNPIRQHGAQDIDHLPVTARLAFQFVSHAADRER